MTLAGNGFRVKQEELVLKHLEGIQSKIAEHAVAMESLKRDKEQIAKEVLDKLRNLAKMEAELLFREFKNYGESLPQVNKLISGAVNIASDTIAEETMEDLAFDNVHEHVQGQYITNAIASCLASKLVYKEGTMFVETISFPPDSGGNMTADARFAENDFALFTLQLPLKWVKVLKKIMITVDLLEFSNRIWNLFWVQSLLAWVVRRVFMVSVYR